jgi:cytochrome P450
MNQAFSPTLVRRLSDHIGELVDELLEPALEVGQLDVVTDLAFPLPVMVVCELIGIPATERNSVRTRAIDLCKAFGTRIPDHNRASANEAVLWLRDYIERLINQRRKTPTDDLLSRMLAAQEGDFRFTVPEIIDNVAFLFFAGFETTMNLIATGCSELLKYPGELRRLRAEPSIVTTAVEEFLRYDAPIQSVARLVREPIEIDGRTIRSGRVLVLLLGSANHDECQFFEPEKLDIGRKPNPHVSFGGGIHHCLGAALARVEAAVVFGRVAQRFSVFEPAGEAVRQPSASFRTYASVPVTVKPK